MGINADLFGDDELILPLMYRGVVENVDDPEKAGRVQIRVMGVHSDNPKYVETQHLPWAIPASNLHMGGGLRNIGSYKVPDIGSHVFIFFEAGDHNFPVYFATAPAIEDVDDYQEKDGKFQDKKYQYAVKSQYDDQTDYSDTREFFETPKDDEISHPVQDFAAQTRKNTFGDGGSEQIPPPIKTDTEPQAIFPSQFFQKKIRVAFDGKANQDAPGYNGIQTIQPSNDLNQTQMKQELDLWDERKWGYNDDDEDHQHDFSGGSDWKPEYPMCSTERNAQGEITDRDILKERITYIHPSKYLHELIQLDSSRKKDDFLNEKSIKNVYERQRGKGNSPEGSISKPYLPPEDVISNTSSPIKVTPKSYNGRKNNDITYDDIDSSTRTQTLSRFEERKHNPGREKTVIEDFVYRYYANKVNETYNVDRNTRLYTGNDNMEIEHGDRNYRQHRGSHNQHLDIGNVNRTINKGWEHLHIDDGHHFIEINGDRPFETSGSHESLDKMDSTQDYQSAQHTDVADKEGEKVNGISSFDDITYNETDRGSQFILIHPSKSGGDANQTMRLEKGHQLIYLLEGNQTVVLDKGDQGFHLKEGQEYILLDNGSQKFVLLNGNMERQVNGQRNTSYTGDVTENTDTTWNIIATTAVNITAPSISLNGNVTISGNLSVLGDENVVGACSGPNNVK